ncbi:BMP/retinoic acid-inducible neural-specific protein 2 [Nothobranchius furzeri]|uniref:BMP/retinoic acid-inducible neural-specific protein 3-like n=2 Tax=Nothobranchius TaxID=28779 RepID=A0A1A8UX34_NOTFU|nr:BMP/retinoic acid-inducible neural-specific protein 2 [Nothobranchius furzeri]XP_054592777.1 BMP/retinoic acid-inducible neural-specific protein 2 [Nothobranchius furzeri]XP_054592778.1 BMP/retinoic acid-inducible neural-specific protein 2 [Nothobranchius furzeri]KAF7222857.1 BMP/retinoic acid-inducible neural-specific protein 3-like [Nothobranchius furzeri]
MATPWQIKKERCLHGFASLIRWSASSLMLLWLPCVLLWLPWPTKAEQLNGGGPGGKVPHSSLSSAASSSPSSSSSSPSSSSAWGFNTRQSGGQLDWLLSEKGPFHRCPEYTEFRERFQQGFSTRYKIYREFSHWKVNSLATEKRNFLKAPLPLAPEFLRNLRLLGRRPTLQQINENLIKKYGTHFLVSATLGGEESLTIFLDKQKLNKKSEGNSNSSVVSLELLHQLAASYFTDRESTLRRLHHLQIATSAIKVTETRTGPLGCSNYDSLDSVSSVLVHSPENKIHLKGLQDVLPEFLRSRFVEAALSYVACNSEGQLLCRSNDCWCRCSPRFPECNCPFPDIKVMEENLEKSKASWNNFNQDFMESDEFKAFLKRLPTDRFLNVSTIAKFWSTDLSLQKRYTQLEASTALVLGKAQKIVRKLFTLSKRCPKQPRISLPRERPVGFWLSTAQSLLYCNEHGVLGSFSEEVKSCSCPVDQPTCQGVIPCVVGTTPTSCSLCATDNATRCGACHHGNLLHLGSCRPSIASSLDHYLNFDLDMPDAEVKYLLKRLDSRIEVHAIYISNDVRLGSWFNPAWRKRMLLTLKSNKNKSNLIHMLMGISFQICLTKNSTLEPVPVIYVNPFGGSHSESWFMPVNQPEFPDWERTRLDSTANAQCYNWTLSMGSKWKSFFETVHIYLRSRIVTDDPTVNETLFYEPLDLEDQTSNMGYMKINTLKVFGYSMHFDPEGIKDLILQLDYPYTQGTQDAAFLMLLEMRDRINRLSPPAPQPLDLFSCLLRHRLKLSAGEMVRIKDSLQIFNSKLPNAFPEPDLAQLCS